MESLVASKLSEYGPLGIFVLLQLAAIVFLWRQNASLYRDNMALHDKRIADIDRYAAKHAELVAAIKQAVDSMSNVIEKIYRSADRRNK